MVNRKVITTHSLGGRPRGIIRRTHVNHGAYVQTEHLGEVLAFWKKHKPSMAAHAAKLIEQYLRALGWTVEHERFHEVEEVVILTIARGALFMKVFNVDFTRLVRDPATKNIIKERPAEQMRRLEELDADIQLRIVRLGLLSTINK